MLYVSRCTTKQCSAIVLSCRRAFVVIDSVAAISLAPIVSRVDPPTTTYPFSFSENRCPAYVARSLSYDDLFVGCVQCSAIGSPCRCSHFFCKELTCCIALRVATRSVAHNRLPKTTCSTSSHGQNENRPSECVCVCVCMSVKSRESAKALQSQ